MDLRLLGPLEASSGSTPIPLGGPKQKALLARLLLDLGRPVAIERLIDDLWGERVPESAPKMVQVYVSQLRKVLPEGMLVTRPPGYLVAADPEDVDLYRFERLVDQGRAAMERGDPVGGAELLRQALALWRGTACGEFREPFAVREAARLEEMRLACLEDRIEADLASGRHGGLAGELDALVSDHPLHERLRLQLMLCLYRSGRQADALEAYRAYRITLDEELGIAPSARLQELELLMLRQAPELEAPPPPPERRPTAIADEPVQEVKYCTSADGTRLAYAIHGQGPPLVRVATWLTHLKHDWRSPVWRHWLEGLGERHTVIRYDERGCGLSDRQAGELSLDGWVEDLESVVDAAGHERFDLLGMSQGGAVAIAYAVRHPERVRRMVFYGAYARGRRCRGDAARVQESEALASLIRAGWSRPGPAYRRVFTTLFLPDGTPEQMEWFDELQRVSSDGETAARLREARDRLDVTELARRVASPALVLHARGDRMVPLEEGRLLAELVPGARFVPLASRNHILLVSEMAWATFLGQVDSFLHADDEALVAAPRAG